MPQNKGPWYRRLRTRWRKWKKAAKKRCQKINRRRLLTVLGVILSLVLLALIISLAARSCRKPIIVLPTATPAATATPTPIRTPTATVALAIAPTCTATSVFVLPTDPVTASVAPTTQFPCLPREEATVQLKAGTPTPQIQELKCGKNGVVAWHGDNLANGEVHPETVLGAEDEPCWIVGQVWTEKPLAVFVFAVQPKNVVAISGFRGGTAWFLAGDRAAAEADMQKQVAELNARKQLPTSTAILPEQKDQLGLPVRVLVAANTQGSQ